MNFRILLRLVPLVCLGFQGSAQSLSLESGWELLRHHHGTLGAARARVDQREALREATAGLLRPQVDLETRYTHIDSAIEIDLEPVRQVMLALHPQVPSDRLPPLVTTVQERDFVRASLNVTWPVYTGGRIRAARRAAGSSVDEARAQLELTETDLLRTYVQRYGALLLARRSLTLQEARVRALQLHLERAEQLHAMGQIAAVDVLHARVSRDEARRDASKAASTAKVAAEALSSWLGRPIAPEDSLGELALLPVPPELESFHATGFHRHPALQQLHHLGEQARHAMDAEQGRWQPEVFVFGRQELIRSGLTLLDPEWAVGVGLRWSVLDRSSRRERVLAARHQIRQVQLMEWQADRDLHILALQSFEQWTQSIENDLQLRGAQELTAEALRLRERAFTEGQATSLEVVDAQLAHQRVQLARAMAAYESLVAAVQTAAAMGESTMFWQWLGQGAPSAEGEEFQKEG